VVSLQTQIGLALAAYASYVVNAGQFLYKLRLARLAGVYPQGVTA
jgi:3-vinyl bacteriochlorophyllide hydratase